MGDHSTLIDVEALQLVLTVVALAMFQQLDPVSYSRCSQAFRRLAERRTLAVVLCGLLGFALSASLTVLVGEPIPRVHDEFCYLLQADTFAHGRLSNPAHPQWTHFEAIHINHQPTYHSMYPPGQAVLLAVGQVLTGSPIVGVWISVALACSAICWMLQAWCPARWALAGGILAAFRFALARHPSVWMLQVGYWSHSYWGGAVALLGGALVFGGVRRIAETPSIRDATLLSVGLAILANSRPFEGFVASLPVAAIALAALWRYRRQGFGAVCRVAGPLVLVLAAAFAWMGYYNWRTTGDWRIRPYELNGRIYAVTPTTLLQTIRPEPEYRHEQLYRYHADWARSQFLRQQNPAGYLAQLRQKAFLMWSFYFGLLLSIPLIALPWALRDNWNCFAVFVCGLVLCALTLMPWFQVHYLAPIAPLFIAIEIACLRILSSSRCFGRSLWRVLGPSVIIAHGIAMPVCASMWSRVDQSSQWYVTRQSFLDQLLQQGGRHLVLVSGNHSAHDEWVYNGADLIDAPVIWAHDMGAQNRNLLPMYADRKVWMVNLDDHPVALKPLAASDEPTPPPAPPAPGSPSPGE